MTLWITFPYLVLLIYASEIFVLKKINNIEAHVRYEILFLYKSNSKDLILYNFLRFSNLLYMRITFITRYVADYRT